MKTKMHKKFPIIVAIVGILLANVLAIFTQSSNVYAASAIDDKYKAHDLLNCYSQRMKKELVPDQVTSTLDLLLDEWQKYGLVSGPKDKSEPLGGLHTEESGKDEIGCVELLESLGFTVNGSNAGDVLKKLGYEAQTTTGKCVSVTFQSHNTETDKWTDFPNKPKLCASAVDSNGVIQGELLAYDAEVPDGNYDSFWTGFYVDGNNIHLYGSGTMAELLYESENCGFFSGCKYEYVTYEPGVTKWSDLVSKIDSKVPQGVDNVGSVIGMIHFRYNGSTQSNGDSSAVSSYKMGDYGTAFKVGYKNGFGKDYPGDAKGLQVTKEETAVLYQNYLNDYFGVKSDACADTKAKSTEAASNLGDSWVQTKVYGSDGKAKYCYITATKNDGKGVYGVNGANNTTGLVSSGRMYWQDLAAWLLANGPNSVEAGAVEDVKEDTDDSTGPTNPDNPDDGENSEANELEEACFRQAKSLGWIICPIIFGLQEVSTGIYQEVEPMIRVNDTVIGQIQTGNSGGGEMFKAWNTFRGIANIIFVILFLFIIFSQLTGFGIDNYGIKKMLPKVIVTAILVNISFLICAVAVDVSNVLGKALQDLFTSIAPSGGVLSSNSTVQGTIDTINNSVERIAKGAGVIGTIGAFALNGWALIIPILLFLITMIISIVFALIVLGLRQAFVVILIIVAPIAFACTLLPNTESVFKKWFDFFKQILMVYPIVGGLIGAGYFVARMILVDEADLIMTITAGMLCVAPYFLVPSLTRKSLAAAGNIGERLRGLGSNANRRVSGLNNSQGVRDARARSRTNAIGRRGLNAANRAVTMGAAKWAAENSGEGHSKKRRVAAWALKHSVASGGRLNRVSEAAKNQVALSQESAYNSALASTSELKRMNNGGYEARSANLQEKALEEAVADQTSLWDKDGTFGNDEKFQNEVYNAAVKGDDAKLEALMRKATNGSDKQRENLRKGMDRAFASGNVSAQTAGRFAAHVSNNGIYKNQNRSMHDQATALANAVGNGNYGTPGNSSADFVNSNYVSKAMSRGKQSAAAAFNYDDGEFNALMEKAKNGTAAERQAIASFMDQAQYLKANDPNGQYNNVKPEAMASIAAIKQAALDGGGFTESDIKYTPQEISVDHSQGGGSTTTPPAQTEAAQTAGANTATVNANATQEAVRARQSLDAYTENVIRRVENTSSNINDPKNGGLSAEEGERLIRRAKERYNQKYGNAGGNKGSNAGGEQA